MSTYANPDTKGARLLRNVDNKVTVTAGLDDDRFAAYAPKETGEGYEHHSGVIGSEGGDFLVILSRLVDRCGRKALSRTTSGEAE
jgi:hypothetical protein